jgi:hypothetical protein
MPTYQSPARVAALLDVDVAAESVVLSAEIDSDIVTSVAAQKEALEFKRLPDDIVTASAIPAVNATHETYDLRGAINTALTAAGKDLIDVTRAAEIHGVFKVNNNEGVAHEFRYANGGTADNDDAVVIETTAASAAVYSYPVVIITAASGLIAWEVDDRTKIDGITFQATGYRYVQNAAE